MFNQDEFNELTGLIEYGIEAYKQFIENMKEWKKRIKERKGIIILAKEDGGKCSRDCSFQLYGCCIIGADSQGINARVPGKECPLSSDIKDIDENGNIDYDWTKFYTINFVKMDKKKAKKIIGDTDRKKIFFE